MAQLSKFKEGGGLGISLEGTVDVENGQEVRPHHYIGSIRPDGPVGLNGRLKTNDELLEVAGQITFEWILAEIQTQELCFSFELVVVTTAYWSLCVQISSEPLIILNPN